MPSPAAYVIAHDSQHPENVGEIVSSPRTLDKMRRAGACCLPIDPQLETELQLGGFVRRSWGTSGIVFDANRGQGGSPLAIQVRAGVPFIHWAAGLVPRGQQQYGSLRLITQSISALMLNSGLAPVRLANPFSSIPPEGTIVSGVSRYDGTSEGFLGLTLWGVCVGVGVTWAAVSQASFAE